MAAVCAGAANSAKILLASASDRHAAGLANGSGQVGRNYMYHNSKAVVALGKEPNTTVFQKTLALNDFYFAGNGRQWPLGNIQMLGKSNAMALKGEEPKLTLLAPRWSLDEVARHAVDFWLTTEDVPKPENRVTAARDEIRAAILEHGWSEQDAFTQAFGSDSLDASNLMLAITGFLPGDDPRMKATIDATAARLTDQRGLVYRYLAHDGLTGEEGTFLLCTFWLAQAQALAGEVDQAAATFERAVAAVNDVGLLAEEVDVPSGKMIGNFPQAFSHIGLVNAAWAITQAQQRTARPDPPAPAGPRQA